MSTTDPATERQSSSAKPAEPATAAVDGWMERLVDRANPILVKEVRQAMKGRGFVISFMLLIACCWIIAVMGALSAGASLEYFDWAQAFFCWFFLPLTVAIGLVVPFLAYSSMLNERLDDTFEMLSITTLNARRIVNGKLTNALMLILMFFSGITPFVAFTSLLQGFRLTPVFIAMWLALLISICLCTAAIFVSTLSRKSRLMQALLSLGLVLGLFACCSLVRFLFEPSYWTVPSRWELWLSISILSAAIIGVIFLVREMAIAQITFESDNRATGVRVVASLIFLATVVGCTVFYFWPTPAGSGLPPGFVTATGPGMTPFRSMRLMIIQPITAPLMLLVLAVSYFSCTEPPNMSRRVLKQVRRRSPLVRLLIFPWMPGCYRGYVFCLLHLLPLALFNYAVATGLIASPISSRTLVAMTICIYGLAYFGFACFLSGVIHRSRQGKQPMTTYVRAMFVAIVAFMAILPHVIVLMVSYFGNGRPVDYSWVMATSPVASMFEAMDSYRAYGPLTVGLMLVGGCALVFLVLNLPGIRNSINEFKTADNASASTPSSPASDDSLKPEAS